MNVNKEGYYLGLGSAARRGNPPVNGYRAVGPDQERNKRIRAFTSELGRLVEGVAVDVWSGNLSVDSERREQLGTTADTTRSCLIAAAVGKAQTMAELGKLKNMGNVWRTVAEPNGGIPAWPKFPPFKQLISDMSQTLEVPFNRMYNQLPAEGGLISTDVGYFVTALLCMADLIAKPSQPILGKYHPNIKIPRPGPPKVKFDVVVTRSSNSDSGNNFNPLLKRSPHWVPLDIKANLRTRESAADLISPSRRINPERYQIDQVTHQLANLMLLWHDRHRDGALMTLPRFLGIVYLRAVPHSIFRIPLSSSLFEEWGESLIHRAESFRESPDAYKQISTLFDLVGAYSDQLKQKEQIEELKRQERTRILQRRIRKARQPVMI